MSLHRSGVAASKRYRPNCPAEQAPERDGLLRLLEVTILSSLAPDDTTRRAYLRDRWQGRSLAQRKSEREDA